MRNLLTAALMTLALCAQAQAERSWDLKKCERFLTEQKVRAGHVCTLQHLETDLARIIEKLEARGDTVDDQTARDWAETGLVEGAAPSNQAHVDVPAAAPGAPATPPAAGSSLQEDTCVITEAIALRAAPTPTSNAVATAPAGLSLRVEGSENGWARIANPGAAFGAFVPVTACARATPDNGAGASRTRSRNSGE